MYVCNTEKKIMFHKVITLMKRILYSRHVHFSIMNTIIDFLYAIHRPFFKHFI
jgi:hypothetical protein